MSIKSITAIIIMVSGCMAFTEPPYKADENTILLYHFDEEIGKLPKDSSNYKNNAKKGQKANGDKGVFGSAMKYSNNTNLIKELAGIEKIKNSGKIELWIKPNEKMLNRWGGDNVVLSSNKGGSNVGDFSIGFRIAPLANGGGDFFLLMEDGKGSYRKLSTPNIIKGSKWYHIVINWDSKSTPLITVNDKVQILKESGKNKSFVGPLFGINNLSIGVRGKYKDISILLDEFRITTSGDIKYIKKKSSDTKKVPQVGKSTNPFVLWKTIQDGPPHKYPITWQSNKDTVLARSGGTNYSKGFYSYFYGNSIGMTDYVAYFNLRKKFSYVPFGFMVHFKDVKNHYLFYVTNLEDIELWRVVDGVRTKIASTRGYIPCDIDNRIEIRAQGNKLELRLNGETVLAARDDALTGGGFGFMAGAQQKYKVNNFRFLKTLSSPKNIPIICLKSAYPLWVVGSEAIIMWETNISTPSLIKYGLKPDSLTLSVKSTSAVKLHKMMLSGLQKGEKYYYQAFSGKTKCGEGSFHTDPGPSVPFRFGVIGDTQTGQSAPIYKNMAKRLPELVLNAGDIVNNGCTSDEWGSWHFKPTSNIYKIAPVYVALGGHEVNVPGGGRRPEAYWFTRYLPYPGTSKKGHYYAFSYGDVRFIILDNAYPPSTPKQLAWLKAELASKTCQGAKWRILVYHEAPYSVGWKSWTSEGNAMSRNLLEPLMKKYGVDIMFNGHTHSYERGYINGILHIIAGGGGSGKEDYGRNQWHVQKFSLDSHYCMVNVEPTKLTINVYDSKNNPLDKITLEKGEKWELSAKPKVIKFAHNGVVGEQEIIVSCPELKGQKVHYRAVLAERRKKDPFWEPSKESWDGGQEVTLTVKFPEPGSYTVKVQALDKELKPTQWVDAGTVKIKNL